LGVDLSLKGNFSLDSDLVYKDFTANMDSYRPTQYYVAALLDRGVKALIYAGKNDFRCSHVGNEVWTRELEWTGHDTFSSQPLTEWFVGDKVAGTKRSANGLTFANIEGAGHMVSILNMISSREKNLIVK
jgi:carboxypeptidase C (cathepsin A)